MTAGTERREGSLPGLPAFGAFLLPLVPLFDAGGMELVSASCPHIGLILQTDRTGPALPMLDRFLSREKLDDGA